MADSLTRTRHDPNQELIGQGLGNLASGLGGGLPGAGATMGTVTSIRAGGRSPVAGALGAVILLTLLLGAGWIAEPIPLAVLAGILLKIGWDVIDWRFINRVHRIRREYVLVMIVTLESPRNISRTAWTKRSALPNASWTSAGPRLDPAIFTGSAMIAQYFRL